MRLSVVIVTHNRRDRVLATLGQLAANPHLPREAMEVLVVDNASADGTADAVAQAHPATTVLRRAANEGATARNHGMAAARGQYIVLLDDDSYPIGDGVQRSMAYLDGQPAAAAVSGRVVLPDGSFEASALPSVVICCAVCLRKAALDRVGLFPPEFGRQAEEYDLSFRLWQEGYRVDRFEDVIYRHEKAPTNRAAGDIHRLDMRNNLIVLARYMPPGLYEEYRHDWTKRYRLLACHAGCMEAARLGRRQARGWRLRERLGGRPVLIERAVESIFGLRHQADAIAQWSQRHGMRRVVVGDFSKNLFATWRACGLAGLAIAAIADPHPAFAGHHYRSIPILADTHPGLHECDAVVLSTTTPARVERRMAQLAEHFRVPILQLWGPQFLGNGDAGAAAQQAARAAGATA